MKKRLKKRMSVKEQRLQNKLKLANQAKTIRQLSEVYAKANAEIEELKNEAHSYKDLISTFKAENENLRVRCEEVEEILRQEKNKLEIANKSLEEANKEIQSLIALKDDYLKAILASSEIREEQKETIERQAKLIKQLEAEMAKPLWKKVFRK